MTDDLGLADANHKDAKEFCKGAFGPFVTDVSQYVDIVAELMQHATDRALRSPRAVPANGAGREALAKTIQQFWQGASGRPWDGCDDSCCVKLPAQADWFRKLADAILALAPSPVVGPTALPRPDGKTGDARS